MHPRLQRRNGTYYLRVAVPRHLRAKVGKYEICRSLKTGSYSEAVSLCSAVSNEIDTYLRSFSGIGRPIQPLHETTVILPRSIARPSKNNDKPDDECITFGQLAELYLSSPRGKALKPKSLSNYRIIYAYFNEVLGERTPLREIGRKEYREARDMLIQMPTNAKKIFPGMSYRRIIACKEAENLPKFSLSNINKYMVCLSTLLSWAVVEEHGEKSCLRTYRCG